MKRLGIGVLSGVLPPALLAASRAFSARFSPPSGPLRPKVRDSREELVTFCE